MIEPIAPISAIEPPGRPDIQPPDALKLRPALNGARRFIVQFAPGTPLPNDDEIPCTASALQDIIPGEVLRSLTFSDETAWLGRLYAGQLGPSMDAVASSFSDSSTGATQPPGFARYYRLRFTGGLDDSYIRDTLARASTITAVQPEFDFILTGSTPVKHSGSKFVDQEHLKAAPTGIAVEAAWDAGAGGEDITIGICEEGPDTTPASPKVITFITPSLGVGPANPSPQHQSHIINVAGVLAAQDNAQNTVSILGVAPHSELLFSASNAPNPKLPPSASNALPTGPKSPYNNGDVYTAMARFYVSPKLRAGDIVNCSIGVLMKPKSPPTLPPLSSLRPAANPDVDTAVPLEIDPALLSIIARLTDRGVTVCMGAGNGYRAFYTGRKDKLDSGLAADTAAVWNAQIHTLDRSSKTFRDAGGIVVTGGFFSIPAVGTPSAVRLRRLNFGNRVDCFAHGTGVLTWDVNGNPDPTFNGTSAATPIVAGAAALVQCFMKQNFGGATFQPLVLRALLSDPVLNVAAIAVDQAGSRPNLDALISLLKSTAQNQQGLIKLLKDVKKNSDAEIKTRRAAAATAATASGAPAIWIHDPYTVWNERGKTWDPIPLDAPEVIFNQPLRTPSWVPSGSELA